MYEWMSRLVLVRSGPRNLVRYGEEENDGELEVESDPNGDI